MAKKQLFWNKNWLENEYIKKERPANDIAKQFGITENAILFWLKKQKIHCRKISQIRKRKYWGLKGKQNGMYGKYGKLSSNWKGGCTPERQAFYSSLEWQKCIKQVWKRDKAICQRCKIKKSKEIKFVIHHIESFSIKDKRTNVDNLVLLCAKCHYWIHSRANREKRWLKQRRL